MSTGSAGGMGQLVTSAPGSLTMDMSALSAALTTSQYSIADIRQAVLTYFFHTSESSHVVLIIITIGQYSNADILPYFCHTSESSGVVLIIVTVGQYSIADIRQAVLTYFCHTSEFFTCCVNNYHHWSVQQRRHSALFLSH